MTLRIAAVLALVGLLVAALLIKGAGNGRSHPLGTSLNINIGTPTQTAAPCDFNATTATFASQISSAVSAFGDKTVCLASGSYGGWGGVNKTNGTLTIKEQSGATATFGGLDMVGGTGANVGRFTIDGIDYTGGQLCGPAHDITIKNATQTGYFQVNPGANSNACSSGPAMNGANIVWDNVTFTLSACPTGSCLSLEGRLSFGMAEPGGGYPSTANAGVTVRNSRFTGNCGDGLNFAGVGNGVLIQNNEFTNLLQGACAPHVDSVQFEDGCCVTFDGNWFHGSDHGIVGYDGGTSNLVVTDNVFGPSLPSDAYCVGGGAGNRVEHNTFTDGLLYLCVNHSNAPTTGVVWRNNIQHDNPTVQGSSTYASGSPNYNLCIPNASCPGANSVNGTPIYVGGASPSTYAGFALAGGSLGKAAASDGTDIGINP